MPKALRQLQTGAVTIQRFGFAIGLHNDFHGLVLDGVCTRQGDHRISVGAGPPALFGKT